MSSTPSSIDPSTISFVGKFLPAPLAFFVSKLCTPVEAPDSGNSILLHSLLFHDAVGDQEWMSIDTVLIRLTTSFTPHGRSPVLQNQTVPYSDSGERAVIGYDVAVCVQRYESWIVETYNTSIASPSTFRIIGKGNASSPLPPSGNIQGAPITGTRYLGATGKDVMSLKAHANNVKHMEKGDDRDREYLPTSAVGPVVPSCTPLLLTWTYSQTNSFTEGAESGYYTELSPDRLAVFRTRVSAVNVLPYLVGSGSVVAQSYKDETLADATYESWQLIGLPTLIWILGIIGELFVPRLPLGIPRREFGGIYGWLALFRSQVRGLIAFHARRGLSGHWHSGAAI